ncbi:MAG: hypothetical protein ACK4GD_13005 [Sphingomonadaceae bacterium]
MFAALPPEQQLKAFAAAPGGTRKVVLATNIAESSVTISGVRYVVDPCLSKVRATRRPRRCCSCRPRRPRRPRRCYRARCRRFRRLPPPAAACRAGAHLQPAHGHGESAGGAHLQAAGVAARRPCGA